MSANRRLTPDPSGSEHRYDAFISYRHVEPDRRWAQWLHKAIETYRVPRKLAGRGGLRRRVGPVFRDEDELPASADLSREIDQALQQSRFLIVICSPRTPQSEWVNREAERFRELGRGENILALLIEGEPAQAFPRALCEIRRRIVDESGLSRDEIEQVEPLAADVRPTRSEGPRYLRRMARLRLLACILGCRFDELRQREQERRTRRLVWAGGLLGVLLMLVSALAAVATIQRAEAVRQRGIAEARSRESRQRLITLYVDKCAQAVEGGDLASAMLWCATALVEDDPASARADLHRLRMARLLATHPRLSQFWWHDAVLTACDISRDGRIVMTASVDGTVCLWDARTGAALGSPRSCGSQLLHAALSPDGSRVAVCSEDKLVRVWDARSGQDVCPPLRHEATVTRVAFLDGGQRVVAAWRLWGRSQLGMAKVWDVRTGQAVEIGPKPFHPELEQRTPSPSRDNSLSAFRSGRAQPEPKEEYLPTAGAAWFAPDGRRALTTSLLGGAMLWDAEKDRSERLTLFDSPLFFTFSPRGDRVMVAQMNGDVQVWDATKVKPKGALSSKKEEFITGMNPLEAMGPPPSRNRPHGDAILTAAFRADSELIATGGIDGTVRLWRPATGEPACRPLRHGGAVSWVAFGGTRDSLVTASTDTGARLWDVSQGESGGVIFEGRVDEAWFTPDGQRIVTLDSKGSLRLWTAASCEPVGAGVQRSERQPSDAVSADGRYAFGKHADGSVRVRSIETGQPVGPPLSPTARVVRAVFSADAASLLVVAEDSSARIWDVQGGRWRGPALILGGRVSDVAFSADGRQAAVLTESGDQTHLAGWDVSTGRALFPPRQLKRSARVLQYGPDGRVLALVGRAPVVCLVSASTGEMVADLPQDGVKGILPVVVFSPDGQCLATRCLRERTDWADRVAKGVRHRETCLRVWETRTGRLLAQPVTHQAVILDMAFSGDSRRLAGAGGDGRAWVWDVATGEPLGAAMKHPQSVREVLFMQGGHCLATACEDGAVRLWDASTGERAGPPLRHSREPSAFRIMFGAGAKLLTVGAGQARLWDVRAEDRPAKGLLLLAQLLSCMRIDSSGSVVELSPQELREIGRAIRSTCPSLFAPRGADLGGSTSRP